MLRTTSAAGVKAQFLKEIILKEVVVAEISPTFAFELLSHMKGGPSVEVLLDLALGQDTENCKQCGRDFEISSVLYEADTDRLEEVL